MCDALAPSSVMGLLINVQDKNVCVYVACVREWLPGCTWMFMVCSKFLLAMYVLGIVLATVAETQVRTCSTLIESGAV